ncbi:MAG: EcsC family protein [Moraxella sp.]|nr:EcsC family protein [Moraxella sp.]
MSVKQHTPKDSVLNDESLGIDVHSDEVEVLAEHVDLSNKAVLDVAVIKNTAQSSDDASQTDALKAAAEEKLADTKAALEKKGEALKEAADILKDELSEKATTAQEGIADTKETLADEVADTKEAVVEKIDTLKETAQEKSDELKDAAQSLKDTAMEQGAEKLDALKDKAAEIKDALSQKAQALKENAEGLVGELKEKVQGVADETSAKTDEIIEGAKGKFAETKDKFTETKDKLVESVSDTKAAATEKADALKAQGEARFEAGLSGLRESGEELKTKAETLVETTKASLQETSDTLQASLQENKEALSTRLEAVTAEAAAYQSHASGVLGKLGAIGAYAASLYATKSRTHTAVDLSREDFGEDVFRRQSSQIGRELFGAKGVTAGNLVNKFMPDNKINALSDAIYGKVANWAETWAKKELGKDSRFSQLDTLSDFERECLADDISNQNRALATLGGVTGLMGLKGVIVDTAWLLMVSLKSVYQLSLVYGKPLTGKAGVKLAYGILSACDLDKLQEKQVIMTALALGDTVLKNAQSTGLADELKKLGDKYQNRSYAKQLDELSKYVDLDKFNPKWLHYVLPIGSSVVSAHYNNELIEEVLGVARATFSEKTPLAHLEDQSQAGKLN